eukprot:1159848-Pelagomonas_calceolata.AAC.1
MQLASTLRQLGAQGRSPSLILSLAHAKAASGSLPLWLSWSLRQVCLAGFMQLAVARASRTSPNEHEAAFLQKYSPSLWMPLMQLMDGISLQTAPAAQHRQLSSESNKQVQGTPSRSGPATPTPSSSSLSTPRLQPSPLMRRPSTSSTELGSGMMQYTRRSSSGGKENDPIRTPVMPIYRTCHKA